MLASALFRPALVLPSAVCSARRWLDPEPTMIVECASCRPFCWLLVKANPSSVEGGDGEAEGRTTSGIAKDAAESGEKTKLQGPLTFNRTHVCMRATLGNAFSVLASLTLEVWSNL